MSGNPSTMLPEVGYLRLSDLIGDPNADPPKPGIFPWSKATLYNMIKDGRFPAPDKRFGERMSVWNVNVIRSLIE